MKPVLDCPNLVDKDCAKAAPDVLRLPSKQIR